MTQTRVDGKLEALADVDRRRVLEYLRRGNRGRATLEELVDHLQSGRAPGRAARTHRRDRDRTRIVLVQKHLPKLADTEVVVWDRDRAVVRYRRDEVVEGVLDGLPETSALLEG